MTVDETLMCSFQILKPAEQKGQNFQQGRPNTPPRNKVIIIVKQIRIMWIEKIERQLQYNLNFIWNKFYIF
jgi:hypothetical protein